MNLSELGTVGAVLVSVLGYAISYFQSKKNIAKINADNEKNQAVELVKLIDRIEQLEQHKDSNIEFFKELKICFENLNKTLESMNIKLAVTSTEIVNLKDKVK